MPLNYSNATEPYHIWVPRDPLGGIPWVGYLGGTDGTLGPMGPWDRWDLGLKDPGPQGPPIINATRITRIPNTGAYPGAGSPAIRARCRPGYPGPVPDAGCRAGRFSVYFPRKNSKNYTTDPRDQKKIKKKT